MKALLWTEKFYPALGGAEHGALQLIQALRARGHVFAVVTTHFDPSLPQVEVHSGVLIRRFNLHASIAAGDLSQIVRERQRVAGFKREFAPDLDHIFGIRALGVFYLQTRASFPAPLLVSLRNSISEFRGALSEDSVPRAVLASADWVTTLVRQDIDPLLNLLPELARRISYITNAIQPLALNPVPLPETPRLLCVARLAEQKRLDLLLRAFAEVILSAPRVTLTIAGDGPDRPQLEQQVAELGLASSVQFLGWVPPPEIPNLINSATCLVLASDREGIPRVGLEAAALERPLIATRVGGVPDFVVDGETGLLTPPGDVSALARAITFMLSHPERAAAMGLAARTRAQEHFRFEQVADAFDTLYRQLARAEPTRENECLVLDQ
jgi:glycosyltransferase involved in cell wall biosynthesis